MAPQKNLVDGDQTCWTSPRSRSTFFSAPEEPEVILSFLRFPVPRETTPGPFWTRAKKKKRRNTADTSTLNMVGLGRLSRPHHSPQACPTRTILICQILRSDRCLFRQSTERARAKKNSVRRDSPRRLLIFEVLYRTPGSFKRLGLYSLNRQYPFRIRLPLGDLSVKSGERQFYHRNGVAYSVRRKRRVNTRCWDEVNSRKISWERATAWLSCRKRRQSARIRGIELTRDFGIRLRKQVWKKARRRILEGGSRSNDLGKNNSQGRTSAREEAWWRVALFTSRFSLSCLWSFGCSGTSEEARSSPTSGKLPGNLALFAAPVIVEYTRDDDAAKECFRNDRSVYRSNTCPSIATNVLYVTYVVQTWVTLIDSLWYCFNNSLDRGYLKRWHCSDRERHFCSPTL